jgi:hypothetical protein
MNESIDQDDNNTKNDQDRIDVIIKVLSKSWTRKSVSLENYSSPGSDYE